MKKYILAVFLTTAFCSTLLVGCKGDPKKAETPATEAVKDQYQCPMKCTEQLFDKPGKCPVCEMELIKVTKS
jgi:hypothetical protein